jgi:hypothetical protein
MALAAMLAFLIAGCQRVSRPAESTAQADGAAQIGSAPGEAEEHNAQRAIETVRRNLAAMQNGTPEEVLATIHPQSGVYGKTRKVLTDIAKKFKLRYDLQAVSVVSVEPEEIRIRFEQVTEKISGTASFRKNRVRGVHTLKPDGQQWKIWSTKIDQVEQL